MNRTVAFAIASSMLAIIAGCHQQEQPSSAGSAPQRIAPASSQPFGVGFKTGILQSPTIAWPAGSVADVVNANSLPIETIDALPGKPVEKGQSVLTYEVRGAARQMSVTADDVATDQFTLQSAELQSDQSISLAQHNVTAAKQELEEARRGEGAYGPNESRKNYEAAVSALARAKSGAEAHIASTKERQARDEAKLNSGDVSAIVSELDAPISGAIVWLKAKVGKSAGAAGTVVGELANSAMASVRATFPDRNRPLVLPNKIVQVEFAGSPNWMV